METKTKMKTQKLLIVSIVSAGLATASVALAHGQKQEQQAINQSAVPAAVQQAAQTQAKGQNVVRWEKQGANYEAVVNQNGKEMGITIDPSGKVLSKHNEANENKATTTKYKY